MDITLSTREGTRYQLIFDANPSRPEVSANQLPKSDAANGSKVKSGAASETIQQAMIIGAELSILLRSATPENASTWDKVWRSVKPSDAPEIQDESAILDALKELIESNRVYLHPLESKSSSTRGSSGNSGGAASGGGGSSSKSDQSSEPDNLGPAAADKPVSAPPKASPSAHSEKEAAQSTAPTNDGTQTIAKTEDNGDPVSMVTGEEMLQHNDFSLPGPLPFTWMRTYRSSHNRDIGLGAAWSHAGSEHFILKEQVLTYVDDEGREIPFRTPKVNQRSKYLPEGLNLDRLSENSFLLKRDGHWDKVFSRPNATVSQFRLTQIRHTGYSHEGNASGKRNVDTGEQGYCLTFHYNQQNRLSSIQSNWGKSLQISRNDQGRISQVALKNDRLDKTKTLASYDYDDQGDLIAHRNAKGIGEQYTYKNHLLIKRVLATGFTFEFEWSGDDHRAQCVHSWGERGIYEYYFDWDNQTQRSRATDSRGFQSEYKYNEYGQIVAHRDNEGGIHRSEYALGRKVSETNPEGHTTTYFYDKENHASGLRDALGHTITLDYFKGRPTHFIDKDKSTWRREYNLKGQLTALIDPYNQYTRYTYNRQGLLTHVTTPMKQVTEYQWNVDAELIRIIEPNGYSRALHYDAWGQVVAMEVFAPAASKQAKDNAKPLSTTQYRYNATGFIEEITAPNGDKTHYTYNDHDQLIRHSDPQGRTTDFTYDGLSQVVERQDAEGHRLKYEYDTERNLTALINENGERYQFFYDGNERLIKEIGFDGRVQHYKYNKAGHLIKHMDAGEVLTTFERDALGQMVTKTSVAVKDSDANSKNGAKKSEKVRVPSIPEERTRYSYDAKGRLVDTYNAHQYVAFEYNLFGNITNEHHSDIRPGKPGEQANRLRPSMVDIGFNNIWPGIRSGIQLPDGTQIDYEFDAHNRFTGVYLNKDSVATIDRDNLGREVARHQGNLSTLSEYDPMGRLHKQHSVNAQQKSPGPIQREYGYNAFGNLETLIDSGHETRFIYDMVNRLEKVERKGPTSEGGAGKGNTEYFHFDPASNLVAIDGRPISSKVSHRKNEGNRLTFQGDRKFTYDTRGNLIRENRGKEGKLETHYHYNLNNQLVKVEKEGQTTEYTYDPLGRRITKSDAFGTTNYLWAGDQLTQERRKHKKKTYLYEPESFRPVAMVEDEKVYHYHLDHLGTPQELSDDKGKVVWKARYQTYGNVAVKEVEEVENNLRFQGQYFDEESGLHYNRHRYYNPHTGQFVHQDPVGLLGGLNSYQYAPNPTHWVDPLGLKCKENSWNKFQKDTKGHFANSSEAANAYSRMKEVEVAARGSKPDSAASYLPVSYIDASMQKFNMEGSSFIVIESWTTGSRFSTLPPRKFVGLPSEMRPVINDFEASGDVSILNDRLNLGLDPTELAALQQDRIMYVEIEPGDPRFSYDMPSGNEFGAIEGEWKPGGKTKDGVSEAALVGSEKIDHEKSLSGYSKNFNKTRIIKDN